MSARAAIAPERVGDTTLIRLEVAARLAFPDGSIGLSALRREAAKGRLTVWRVANKDMTTLAEIKLMVERCRVPRNPPDSGFVPHQTTARPSGSSSMAENRRAQDALLERVRRLKGSLNDTSAGSGNRRKPSATVHPLKSP